MTTPSRASAVLAKFEGLKSPKKIETITNKKGDKVILVKSGDWDYHRKAANASGSAVKTISMVGGRDGADYEIIYRDYTTQLFKFDESANSSVNEALKDTDFAILEVTFETPSKSSGELDNANNIIEALLDIDGVSDVAHYASFAVTCTPEGLRDRDVIDDLTRIRAAVYKVLKEYDALEA